MKMIIILNAILYSMCFYDTYCIYVVKILYNISPNFNRKPM